MNKKLLLIPVLLGVLSILVVGVIKFKATEGDIDKKEMSYTESLVDDIAKMVGLREDKGTNPKFAIQYPAKTDLFNVTHGGTIGMGGNVTHGSFIEYIDDSGNYIITKG